MATRGDGPRRTCAGCGTVRAQHELIRFGAVDGVLTVGRNVSGRGVYTCRSRTCFDSAVTRRSFARVLRARVVVPESMAAGLYTGAENG